MPTRDELIQRATRDLRRNESALDQVIRQTKDNDVVMLAKVTRNLLESVSLLAQAVENDGPSKSS